MTIAATRSGKIEGFEQRRRARVPRHPVRGAARSARCRLHAARSARTRGTACATRRSSRRRVGAGRLPDRAHARRAPAADSSEDSLYLNVWTPACDDARRPVMVWIHGGAFVFGVGRHALVRRHALRAARRRRGRHDQLPPRPVRLPAPRRPVRRRARGLRQRRHPRPGRRARVGARLHRRRSAAIPTTSRSSASRPARRASARCSARPRARGLFTRRDRAERRGVVGLARASAATEVARRVVDEPRRRAPATSTRCARSRPTQLLAAHARRSAKTASPRSRSNRSSTAPCSHEPPLDAIAAGNAAGVHLLTGTNRTR